MSSDSGSVTEECDCLLHVNRELKPMNLKVDVEICFAPTDIGGSLVCARPIIKLRKRKADIKTKFPVLMARYCPFCGKAYPGV